MYRLTSPRSTIYILAAFFSVICSLWISNREAVINSDAICYLQSAATMKEGIHVAMDLCGQAKWPLYSLLIAGFVKVTHLPYVTAAYILNGFFSLLTVLAFISIVNFLAGKSLQNNKLLVGLSAAVILLAHEWNAVKTYIIRDHGFWAFYLLSILFLLYFFRDRQWRYALAWSASSLIATLFRIEGAVFLLTIPFISWLGIRQPWRERVKSFVKLNTLTLVTGIFICGWLLFHHSHATGRLGEVQYQLTHGIELLKQNFQLKALGLAQGVLGENGARDATPVLLITLVVWYVVSVAGNLSLIYSLLLLYAWIKKLLPTEQAARLVLWSYVIINIIVTAVFLGQNMFLSKRYLIALSLTLMLWVPFALYHLLKQWQQQKWPLVLAALFIFISSLGGIFDFGYSKQYMRDAGEWLAKNVSPKAHVYSNDLQVMYYSQLFGNQIFTKAREYHHPHMLEQNQWKKYDYIVLRLEQKDISNAAVLQDINLMPIQIFQNKRGDQVRIYRRTL
jgi:hypothetical protein